MKARRKAQIWLVRGEKTLVLRRRADWSNGMGGGMDGIWQPVTGHVEDGETFEDGARREAHEETGISPETLVRRLGAHEFDDRWGTHCTEEIFAMEAPEGLEVVLDPTEHIACEWLPLAEALKRVAYPPPAGVIALLKEICDG